MKRNSELAGSRKQGKGMAAIAADKGPAQLTDLPTDVLSIVLRKIGLKDRLHLESVDKGHRKRLMQPELWSRVDLAAMQAVDLSEDQFFHLLRRIDPEAKMYEGQIRNMASVLQEVTNNSWKHEADPERQIADWSSDFEGELVRIPLKGLILRLGHWFERLHRFIPESWGGSRMLAETCGLWVSEQVCWLNKIDLKRVLVDASGPLRRPTESIRKIFNVLLSALRVPDKISLVGGPVILDVSGAQNLSPPFLAACIIALSAADFSVSFSMTGFGDPAFPASPLLLLMQSLALDCSINVKVQLTGRKHLTKLLHSLVTANREQQVEAGISSGLDKSLEEMLKKARMVEYRGSRASYILFEKHIFLLWELSQEIRRRLAHRQDKSRPRMRATFAFDTLVFENMARVTPSVFKEIEAFFEGTPQSFRLVFLNCPFDWQGTQVLTESLAVTTASSLCFQQAGELKTQLCPGLTREISGSQGLQQNRHLKTVEFDYPLSLEDFDSLSNFLRMSQSAGLVIHLRPSVYATDPNRTLLVANLIDLSRVDTGSRLRIVQHDVQNVSGRSESVQKFLGVSESGDRHGLLGFFSRVVREAKIEDRRKKQLTNLVVLFLFSHSVGTLLIIVNMSFWDWRPFGYELRLLLESVSYLPYSSCRTLPFGTREGSSSGTFASVLFGP